MKERNQSLDTLRGLACILLVGYHVIGSSPSSGLNIAAGYYRDINDVLGYIRMPLFTFLSGMVYAYRPFDTGFDKFFKGKFRRLIIPMLFVGTTFAVLQSFVPGSNFSDYDWSMLHIIPVGHFWFVESIFLIFLFVALLEKLNALTNVTVFAVVFIVSCALFLSGIRIRYFGISGALYLLPFFLAGLSIERFSLLKHIKPYMAYIVLICTLVPIMLIINGDIALNSKRSLMALIIGLLFCASALAVKPKNHLLAKIGVFSYTIYLYHVFFTAGTRIALHKIGLYGVELVFLISLTAGLLLPIFIDIVFSKVNITRICLLGKSAIRIQ